MSIIEGWIITISREFPVYVSRAKAEAMAYKYQSIKDSDALDYFYAKINKLRNAQRAMSDGEIIDYIWEDLSPVLQKLLDYAQLRTLPLIEVSRMLGNKDLAYREEGLAAEERRAARDQSSKERHQDRWKLTADIRTSLKSSSKISTKNKIKGKGNPANCQRFPILCLAINGKSINKATS